MPIWIIVSALWFKFESTNPVTKHAFFTMPSSMFYAAIFLGGNWPQYDFSGEGKCVAFVVCLAGIVIFAMPVGTIMDGFTVVLAQRDDERRAQLERKRLMRLAKKQAGKLRVSGIVRAKLLVTKKVAENAAEEPEEAAPEEKKRPKADVAVSDTAPKVSDTKISSGAVSAVGPPTADTAPDEIFGPLTHRKSNPPMKF